MWTCSVLSPWAAVRGQWSRAMGAENTVCACGAFWTPQVSVHDIRRHPWVQLPPGTKTFDKDPT